MGNLASKGVTVIFAWGLVVAPAKAEEGRSQPQEDGSASGTVATVQVMAEQLGRQVDHLIGDLPRPRLDFALAASCDLPQRSDRQSLGELLSQLVASHISRHQPLRSVRRHGGTAWATADRARATAASEGFELLAWLNCDMENNHLVVRGLVYNTEHHLWREVVEPERQVVGHLFLRQRINAELRWYLPPLPAGPLSMTSYPLGEGHYLALSVADLDDDGLNEVVLLTRQALEIRRVDRQHAAVLTDLPLQSLPSAATGTRDPQGTLVVGPPDSQGSRPLAFRTSDHSQGLIVRYDDGVLRRQGTLSDFPLSWHDRLLCAALPPGESAFQSQPQPCGSLEPAHEVSPYYALGRATIDQPRGTEDLVETKVRVDGAIELRWNEAPLGVMTSFGTAVGLADINDDGLAEILLSSNRDPGQGDRLVVVRLGPEGLEPTRETLNEVEGSVWIAAGGDADNDGLAELLAVEQSASAARLLVVEGTSP